MTRKSRRRPGAKPVPTASPGPPASSGAGILIGVIACFVLSGFAALLYQTAWMRQFSVVFGTSEIAIATVALGLHGWSGRRRRGRRSLRRSNHQTRPGLRNTRGSNCRLRAVCAPVPETGRSALRRRTWRSTRTRRCQWAGSIPVLSRRRIRRSSHSNRLHGCNPAHADEIRRPLGRPDWSTGRLTVRDEYGGGRRWNRYGRLPPAPAAGTLRNRVGRRRGQCDCVPHRGKTRTFL